LSGRCTIDVCSGHYHRFTDSLALRQMERFTEDQLEKVVYWALPRLVGARRITLISSLWGPFYHSRGKFAVWEGGMAFYGAILAVVLVILIAGWR